MAEWIQSILALGAAYLIAQAIGPITTVLSIISAQMKNMTWILLSELVINFLVVVSYILLGGFSGSYICLLACVQIVISYIFARRKKDVPNILTAVFVVGYLLISILTFRSPMDILPGICGVGFALSVAQSKPRGYRFFMTVSTLLWIVYDILIGAWGMLITHGMLLISLIIAIVKQDLSSSKQKENNA